MAMIDEGRVLFEGTPEEILASEDSRIKPFVTGGTEWLQQDMECDPESMEKMRRKNDIHAP